MATQNLVSATLSADTKADVMDKLNSVKKSLSFLLSLKGSEIHSLFKAGNGYAPFVEKAYNVVINHPEIMPGVFDVNEFKRDYLLSKDLTEIVDLVHQISDSLTDTLTAVRSDAVNGALDVYSSVKLNSDRVPGLKVVSAEMSDFFKRSKTKVSETV
jgi:hypothetical protein